MLGAVDAAFNDLAHYCDTTESLDTNTLEGYMGTIGDALDAAGY